MTEISEIKRVSNTSKHMLKLQIEFLNAQLKTNVEKSPSPCLKMTSSSIGIAAIGALGTKAPPDKERNLSIRNQKVLKYSS